MQTCAHQTLRLFSGGHLAIITIPVASGLFTRSAPVAVARETQYPDVVGVHVDEVDFGDVDTAVGAQSDRLTRVRAGYRRLVGRRVGQSDPGLPAPPAATDGWSDVE